MVDKKLILLSLLALFLLNSCNGSTTKDLPPSAPNNLTITQDGSKQMVISWSAVGGATSYNLYWANTSSLDRSGKNKLENVTSPYTHSGLANGTTYYYTVTATNSDGESDQSNEVSETPFLIAVFGDTRTNPDIHQKVVNAIFSLDPVMVFHTGDLVNSGNEASEWTTFNDIETNLLTTTLFYPSAGNHENEALLYYDNFELPNNEKWYLVEGYGIHFVILNTNLDVSQGSEQYVWLENDLSGIGSGIDYIVVVFHHPPFSSAGHTNDEKGLRNSIVPLFDSYNLDIAFSGHSHNYERSYYNGTYYIVTGSSGAPLYSNFIEGANPNSQLFSATYNFCTLERFGAKLRIKTFDDNLTKLDEFEVE